MGHSRNTVEFHVLAINTKFVDKLISIKMCGVH